MYDRASDTPALARTSNLNEELGQVAFVLSDKTGEAFGWMWAGGRCGRRERRGRVRWLTQNWSRTTWRVGAASGAHHCSQDSTSTSLTLPLGTLTCNRMDFLACCVEGVAYGGDAAPGGQGRAPSLAPEDPNTFPLRRLPSSFHDPRLVGDGWRATPAAPGLAAFFRALALCHTVIPEGGPALADISYQAASPDEAALVAGARAMGYALLHRSSNGVVVLEDSVEVAYDVSREGLGDGDLVRRLGGISRV